MELRGQRAVNFDLAETMDRLDDDRETFCEIAFAIDGAIHSLLDEGSGLVENDHAALARRAHSLRGALSILSARDAIQALSLVEELALRGTDPAVKPAFTALEETLDVLLAELSVVRKLAAHGD